MSKKQTKKKTTPKPLVEIDWEDPAHATTTRTESNGGLADAAEKVVIESEMMRIRISVSVNGHTAGQPLTVERDNEFYAGLLRQGLATEVGN